MTTAQTESAKRATHIQERGQCQKAAIFLTFRLYLLLRNLPRELHLPIRLPLPPPPPHRLRHRILMLLLTEVGDGSLCLLHFW